jgi:hypothetical protein
MSFCTNCGANVEGAFCIKCGTPVRTAASQPGPTDAPPPAYATPAPQTAVPAPIQRRTSPLVWVLVVILGLFVLCGVAIFGTGMFFMHKARQAGIDSDLLRANPGYAVAKMFIAANPNVEEVRHDDRAGTITVRDRKTGKLTTISFDDIKRGRISITSDEPGGGSVEIGGSAALPAWVPVYPGTKPENSVAVRGSGDDGREGGNVTFTTSDPPAKVLAFYQDKARELGMKVNLTSTGDEGGMVVATDEGEGRTLTAIVGSGTSVNLSYSAKK